MVTIEERAKDFFGINADNYDVFNEDISEKLQYGYIIGAKYQKQIDIEKACKWLRENMNIHQTSFSLTSPPGPGNFINAEEAFRKAMEV